MKTHIVMKHSYADYLEMFDRVAKNLAVFLLFFLFILHLAQLAFFDLPPWAVLCKRSLLSLSMILLALASAAHSAKVIQKTSSALQNPDCNPHLVSLLNNKAAVFFAYSISWIPTLVAFGCIHSFEDPDISGTRLKLLIFSYSVMLNVPITSIQTLGLSNLMLDNVWTKKDPTLPVHRFLEELSLLLPTVCRLFVLVVLYYNGYLLFGEVDANQSTFMPLLLGHISADKAFVHLERYNTLVNIGIYWVYCLVSCLCPARYSENKKQSKVKDFTGVLALFWCSVPYLIFLLYTIYAEDRLSLFNLIMPVHFIMLFSLFIFNTGDDPIYCEVMRVIESEGQSDEEEDAEPLWSSPKFLEAEVKVEGDAQPLWVQTI